MDEQFFRSLRVESLEQRRVLACTLAEVSLLAIPSTVSGQIQATAESNCYSFSAIAGEAYSIETTAGTLSDTTIRLFDTNGSTELAFDDDGGFELASRIAWLAPVDGDYFIEVATAQNEVGAYSLQLAEIVDAHGNHPANASALPTSSFVASIDYVGDTDVFVFVATANRLYSLSATSQFGNNMSLFDLDGTTLLARGSSMLPWTAPRDGAYFIKVEALDSGWGRYLLDVDEVIYSDDHSNLAAFATPRVAPFSQTGVIEVFGDVDYYSFSAAAGETFAIKSTGGSSLFHPQIRVYGTDGVTPLNTEAASFFTATATESGPYFVEVTEPNLVGTYALDVTIRGRPDRLPCDYVGDGNGCDLNDLDALYAGTNGAPTPLTREVIDQWLLDASSVDNPAKSEPSHHYIYGDTNLDGVVDSIDLGLLLNNFDDNSGLGWRSGDFTADSLVGSADLGLLLNNFGTNEQPLAPTAVDDEYTVALRGTLTANLMNGLLANDVNSIEGELVVVTTPLTAPLFGTVSINANGTFTYAHAGMIGDVDTFTYEIINSEQSTSTATVTIRVESSGSENFSISEHTATNALVGRVTPSTLNGNVVYDFALDNGIPSALQLAVDDHIRGDKDAPVVLIEYTDLQCPTCRAFRSVINDLANEFSEELMVVTRHLPLSVIHPHAIEAALFSEAAGQQGMFDEMVDILFEHQFDWANLSDPTSLFEGYARELGLNISDVQISVNDPTTAERVMRDFNAATTELSRNSVPTFFLNNELVPVSEVASEQAFRERIERALSESTASISLNRETGELRVIDTSRLDFETAPNISFEVIATDGVSTETISVNVQITDAADESVVPVLPQDADLVTQPNGLQFFDLEVGLGASPEETDVVRVAYTGYLPNGDVFDSNEDATFNLPGLIQGFSEGVQGMRVGGTRRILIPPDLGYGDNGNPGAGIGGTDTIVFDVTLREIL